MLYVNYISRQLETKQILFHFIFNDFLNLFIHKRHAERGRDIGRGISRLISRLPSEEPDAGLNPRTPGSCPEPKADTQPLSHPGVPKVHFKKRNIHHHQQKQERQKQVQTTVHSMKITRLQ